MDILIAEDEQLDQEILAATLRRLGHEPLRTSHGKQAWDLLLQRPGIDMLITDWMMPELDGLELCRRVRSAPAHRHLYVAMLTARTGKMDLLQAMDAGVDDFISKPIDPDLLAARLRVAERLLGLHRRAQQLAALLPVCAQCGRIRDSAGEWHSLEEHVRRHREPPRPPPVCPACFERMAEPDQPQWEPKP